MKAIVNRFMSLLGYVPAPAKFGETICSLKIEIDSTSVDAALAKVEHLTTAAAKAEVAVLHAGVMAPTTEQFATAELAPLPGQAELIAEVRELICEIRADRQAFAEERKTNNRLFRSFMGGQPG